MSAITNLTTKRGFALVDETSLDSFLASHSETALFFSGDGERLVESSDVAVILPELVKHFGGRLAPAVVDKASERALQRRFCFNAFPALVFLRGAGYLGAITGVLDWREFVAATTAILERDPSAPPPFKLPDGCGHAAAGTAPTQFHSGDDQ
jgi:hydrogenase-1 operon protein HyaE